VYFSVINIGHSTGC